MKERPATAEEAIAVLRSRGFDIWEPSDEDLNALSHMIAEMKRYGKAEKCRNGMSGEPECRSLSEAMSDIRRKADSIR